MQNVLVDMCSVSIAEHPLLATFYFHSHTLNREFRDEFAVEETDTTH